MLTIYKNEVDYATYIHACMYKQALDPKNVGGDKMVRKTKIEAEKTRMEILNGALDVIYEKGYSAANLNEIATRIGMTRGAVYWHFRNKEDLFYSLIEELNQQIAEQFETLSGNVRTLNDLQSFFSALAEFFVRDDRMFKYLIVMSVKLEWNEELKRSVELIRKQKIELESFCLTILEGAEKMGELRAGIDKVQMSKSIVLLMDGVFLSIVPPFGKRNTEIVDCALDAFFKGLQNSKNNTA